MMGRISRTAALIGAPTDVGAADRGASMGPEALRVAGLGAALARHGLKVIDRGNVSGPPNPSLPPVGGYRHLSEVYEWNRNVHDAVYRTWSWEICRFCWAVITAWESVPSALAARHCRQTGQELRVLWLDAHADFNTSDLSPAAICMACPWPACADSGRRN